MIKTLITKKTRIRQGDVYRDIEHIESILEKDGDLFINKISFPYVVVLTQDCDLQQDSDNRKRVKHDPSNNQDKFLISVLVAPVYNTEHFRVGEHLSELSISMRPINWKRHKPSTEATNILNSQNPRYHHLEFSSDLGIPDSIIDFKHYFSVNINYLDMLRPRQFVCAIAPIYREDLCQRFSNYLSRIGLPA